MVNEEANREETVFSAIIAMCSARILYRLRLVRPDRGKTKQTIKAALNEVIRSFQRLRARESNGYQNAIDLSIVKMRAVIKLADTWTKYQTEGALKSLVVGIYDLRQVEQLPAFLNTIPNIEMGPTSRKSVLNIVRKIARYREAVRILCRAARKHSLVQNAKVIAVQLPRNAFNRPVPNNPATTLDSALLRFPASRKRGAADDIFRLLQVQRDEAERLYANQVKKSSREAKFHAEIQIIFYCEMNPTIKAPRVVCSSKDACFLCNAFISMYKRIYTPRCHGRLYPGWRLPQHPVFAGLQISFNQCLEQFLDGSLRRLLSSGKRTLYPDPNESTISTLPYSASTLITASASSNKRIESDSETPNTPLVGEHCAPNTISRIPDDGSEIVDATAQLKDDFPASNTPVIETTSPEIPKSPEDGDIHLVQGIEAPARIDTYRPSRLYKAGQLEVQLEYLPETGRFLPDVQDSTAIPVKIKWLTSEEVEILNQDKKYQVVEVDSLHRGVDHTVRGQNHVYMSLMECVLEIEFRSKE